MFLVGTTFKNGFNVMFGGEINIARFTSPLLCPDVDLFVIFRQFPGILVNGTSCVISLLLFVLQI